MFYWSTIRDTVHCLISNVSIADAALMSRAHIVKEKQKHLGFSLRAAKANRTDCRCDALAVNIFENKKTLKRSVVFMTERKNDYSGSAKCKCFARSWICDSRRVYFDWRATSSVSSFLCRVMKSSTWVMISVFASWISVRTARISSRISPRSAYVAKPFKSSLLAAWSLINVTVSRMSLSVLFCVSDIGCKEDDEYFDYTKNHFWASRMKGAYIVKGHS